MINWLLPLRLGRAHTAQITQQQQQQKRLGAQKINETSISTVPRVKRTSNTGLKMKFNQMTSTRFQFQFFHFIQSFLFHVLFFSSLFFLLFCRFADILCDNCFNLVYEYGWNWNWNWKLKKKKQEKRIKQISLEKKPIRDSHCMSYSIHSFSVIFFLLPGPFEHLINLCIQRASFTRFVSTTTFFIRFFFIFYPRKPMKKKSDFFIWISIHILTIAILVDCDDICRWNLFFSPFPSFCIVPAYFNVKR